jgi:hypothetical protein
MKQLKKTTILHLTVGLLQYYAGHGRPQVGHIRFLSFGPLDSGEHINAICSSRVIRSQALGEYIGRLGVGFLLHEGQQVDSESQYEL